jgi:hypothetical protein
MRSRTRDSTSPASLTYSAPAVDIGEARPDPQDFYNAFPEFNDVALDGSLSAFPLRAKYALALDSEFIPSGKWVSADSIDDELLSTLNLRTRQLAEHARHVKLRGRDEVLVGSISVPRTTNDAPLHGLHTTFEITHKRLASTDRKWYLRTYYVAPLYTILERFLTSGRRILVPLQQRWNGSLLEQQWARTTEAFQPTLKLDEVASLLICVTLLPEWSPWEHTWVAQEENDISGFSALYHEWRDRFHPERCTNVHARRQLAEQILQHAKQELSLPSGDAEAVFLQLPKRTQYLSWPSLLGKESNSGIKKLRVRDDFVMDFTPRITKSIPEAMQWFMALFSVIEDKDLSFVQDDSGWDEYAKFELESSCDDISNRITVGFSSQLLTMAHLGIRKSDGSPLSVSRDPASPNIMITQSMCRYTVFLEAIRQQVCSGVGLRCPFWTADSCCEFSPLLDRTYKVARPWKSEWEKHWQRPPCLD